MERKKETTDRKNRNSGQKETETTGGKETETTDRKNGNDGEKETKATGGKKTEMIGRRKRKRLAENGKKSDVKKFFPCYKM